MIVQQGQPKGPSIPPFELYVALSPYLYIPEKKSLFIALNFFIFSSIADIFGFGGAPFDTKPLAGVDVGVAGCAPVSGVATPPLLLALASAPPPPFPSPFNCSCNSRANLASSSSRRFFSSSSFFFSFSMFFCVVSTSSNPSSPPEEDTGVEILFTRSRDAELRELPFLRSRELAEVVAGFRSTSFGPPDDGGFNNPLVFNPPLAGGVGMGVPTGVARRPLVPAI
mmetsp:Transcript_26207/g.44690  ORF Transcript_26207/g.44690 Transcript_26207/m.44690 type:complete len:225 (-) Transcript_26207:729-1403(-)